MAGESTTYTVPATELHGSNTANCSPTPYIGTSSFTVTFTRDTTDKTKLLWSVSGLSPVCSGASRYDYNFQAAIGVNSPDYPDNWDYIWEIMNHPLYNYDYNWKNHMNPTNPSNCYTNNVTGSTVSIRLYVRARYGSYECCGNGSPTNWCYNNGHGFYLITSYDNVEVPPYEEFYQVDYNTNGGSPDTLPSQTKSSLSALTLYNAPTKFVTVNYHNPNYIDQYSMPFGGWYSSADSQTYASGGSYSLNANTTMTAQWAGATFTTRIIPDQQITVTYNANGGTVSPGYTTYNKAISGYANSSGSTTVYVGSGAQVSNLSTDLDLYPIYGSAKVLKNNIPTPTKSGFAFQGWYFDSTLQNPITDDFYVADNTTIYAKWVALPIHKAKSNGTWSSEGPKVWQCVNEGGTKKWKQVADIYKFDGTSWQNISE